MEGRWQMADGRWPQPDGETFIRVRLDVGQRLAAAFQDSMSRYAGTSWISGLLIGDLHDAH